MQVVGRASRQRAEARRQRVSAGGVRLRPAERSDREAVEALLGMVGFPDPHEPEMIALAVTTYRGRALADGLRAWVAEGPRRKIIGVVVAAPPFHWISSIAGISQAHRKRLAQRIVEAEALAIAPEARGRRLGHQLLAEMKRHYESAGYRLMFGTLLLKNSHLVDYYKDIGYRPLGPGETIHVGDPMNILLSRPADPDGIQLWQPLHPEVHLQPMPGPTGTPVPTIMGALAPPAGMPERVIEHDDGRVTLAGGGRRVTVPAQAVQQLAAIRATPVTQEEIEAAVGEAEQCGVEPLLIAQFRKASRAT